MGKSGISRRAAGLGLVGAGLAPAAFAAGKAQALYFLSTSKVHTVGVDGSGARAIVESSQRGGLNDGIAYDPRGKHLYWTNMGGASADDGFIMRADLDGQNLKTIVPAGGTFTPKQLKLDEIGRKLYWSDREGMRVMRANLDGSGIEVLVQTGGPEYRRDLSLHCVGIAIDIPRRRVYWTQKGPDNGGRGTIRRAPLDIPKGQTAANRTDIETLFSHLPEPIDLDLDLKSRTIYWTDRGDNTVNRAPMDPPRGFDPAARTDRQVLVRGLREAIGLTLDLPNGRMFYTSLGGEVGTAGLDGSDARLLLQGQGTLTGIVLV